MRIVLPGLVTVDTILLQSGAVDDTYTCPMTLNSLSQCETLSFLKEMIELVSDVTIRQRVQVLFERHEADWGGSLGGVEIERCGHVFSTLPLLYLYMTGRARCPICRGGSNREVLLDGWCTGIKRDLWTMLCILAEDAKKRQHDAAILEDAAIAHELVQRPSISEMDVDEMMDHVSFRCYISVYRDSVETTSEFAGRRDNPVAVMVVDMNLRGNRIPLGTDCLKFESASCRNLSRTLRLGSAFAVRIIADAADQSMTIFDSHKVTSPVNTDGAPKKLSIHMDGSLENSDEIGVVMCFEACPYDHVYITQRMCFSINIDALRRAIRYM